MTKLFNNCLTVGTETTTVTGRKIYAVTNSSSQKEVSTGVNMMNSGYGLSMHIYGIDYFRTPSTSTYNENLNKPGPAPDDSSQLSQEAKTRTDMHANIVKFYWDKSTNERKAFTQTPTPRIIEIESEPNYIIEDWYTSTTYRSASNNEDYYDYKDNMTAVNHGSQPETVTLDTETTLYVLLVKHNVADDDKCTIHESEISKPINTDMSDVEIPVQLGSLRDSCKGHCTHVLYGCTDCTPVLECKHECDDACKTKCTHTSHATECYKLTCSHTGCTGFTSTGARKDCWVKIEKGKFDVNGDGTINDADEVVQWVDDKLKFKFKNVKVNDYSNLIADMQGNGQGSVIDFTRESFDSGTAYISGYKFKFIAFRGADGLSYAKYKNNTSKFDFSALSSKLNKTRLSDNYAETVKIELVNNNSDLDTESKYILCDCTNDKDRARLPEVIFTYNVNVGIETYSGILRPADKSLNESPYVTIGASDTFKVMGRMIDTETSIKFNPYIQMTNTNYDEVKENVMVLSEYQREILPNDYAEIGYTHSDNNLLVQSQMWATDAQLTNGNLGWNKVNQVLKGGAALQLTDRSAQKVTVSTYQAILEGEARNISIIEGEYELKASQAETYHKEFVESVKLKLDNTEIAQYISTHTEAKRPWDSNDTYGDLGFEVYRGCDISKLDNKALNNKASTESKYYLDSDVNNDNNAQRADVDVKELGTKKHKYRFYSDVYGNIYMEKTTDIGTSNEKVKTVKLLAKDQGLDDLEKMVEYNEYAAIAMNIDNRTYALKKLLTVIERNTGNDVTAEWAKEDGKWYNEAYYGITIYTQHTDLSVGFSSGNTPLRTTVLDPKLVPYINSKDDQGEQAFVTAFKVKLDKLTPIGKFKNMDVFMNEPDMLLHSRNIYITNMTVDDGR